MFVTLLIPGLQIKSTLLKEVPLYGVEGKAGNPVFTLSGYLDKSFQQSKTAWFKQQFGLRSYLVRSYNQLLYSVFNKTPANQTTAIGKNGQLFKKDYIREFYSPREYKKEKYLSHIDQYKRLHAELSKRDVFSTLLLTPNKVSIYPDELSPYFTRSETLRNKNYATFVSHLKKSGVTFVDGLEISKIKSKTKSKRFEPSLFCKTGHHWNDLGAYYTADVLKDTIEKETRFRFGSAFEPKLEFISTDDDATKAITLFHGHDHDLSRLLNIWFPPLTKEIPHIVFPNRNTVKSGPKVLIIGDSYNYMLCEVLSRAGIFSELDLFYYMNTRINYPSGKKSPINRATLQTFIESRDIIVFSYAEHRVPNGDFNSISQLLSFYTDNKICFQDITEGYTGLIMTGDVPVYRFKKGSPGHMVWLKTGSLILTPGKRYTLSYEAKGAGQNLWIDLYPDTLPEVYNNILSDDFQKFTHKITSLSSDMLNCKIRVFNSSTALTRQDIYLKNIKLIEE